MTVPVLTNVPAYLMTNTRNGTAEASPSTHDRDREESRRSTEQDLAWQRALEQASFAGWFKPWTPDNFASEFHAHQEVVLATASASSWASRAMTSNTASGPDVSSRPEDVSSAGNDLRADASAGDGNSNAATSNSPPIGETRPATSSSEPNREVNAIRPDVQGSHGESRTPTLVEVQMPMLVQFLTVAVSATVTPVETAAETLSGQVRTDALTPTSQVSTSATPRTMKAPTSTILDESPQSIPTEGGGADDSSATSTAASASSSSKLPEARTPLRLYAEWSQDGVRIWLGADANQSLPLVQLVQQIQQWLTSQGERLLALICNGRTVWRDADFDSTNSSETDMPAAKAGSFLTQPNAAQAYPDFHSTLPYRCYQEVS